jgi:hypothetical protein
MKSRSFPDVLAIAAVMVTCLFTRDVMAQIGSSDAATIPNVASTAAPAGTVPVQLSYGVSQIVQLSQAKVNDDTIVNYIRNSGSSYGLDANQIVYLKQQGVSETVINAMLNQPRLTTAAAPPPAQTTVAPPATTYVQPTTAYVPSSTVYVIPDAQSYQYAAWYNYYHPYYGYYGYGCYPYYGGWGYPAVTFSFGYGGGWRGGYRGGWHR